MPLTPSGQLLVDAGMRELGSRENNVWLQWKANSGWTGERRQVGVLPPLVLQIAEEALYRLRGVLRNRLDSKPISDEEEVVIQNDLEHVDLTLVYLKSEP